MATKRQKERKKKDREGKAKARVQARRHKMHEINKGDAKARKLEIKFRDKLVPFVKDPEKRAEIEASEQEKVKQRLEKNMQILKALEEEYEAEQSKRREFNQQLEAQGHETLQEKLNSIESAARESDGESSAEATI